MSVENVASTPDDSGFNSPITKTASVNRDPDRYIQELIFGDIFEGMEETRAKRAQARSLQRNPARTPTDGPISSTPSSGENPGQAQLPAFRVIRSTRRKRGIMAIRQNGLIEIHIPDRMTRKQEREIIPEMIGALLRREARSRRGNEVLEKMALELLAQYLPEFDEVPASIRWASMRERWGSCTTVDRTIRISDRLNGAPEYVLHCVIFHELIHLRVADHSQAFYDLLSRYSDLARAESWLEGFEAGIQVLPDSPILSDG